MPGSWLRLGWVALVPCSAALRGADDWPQFRGPNAAGVSHARAAPQTWGPDKQIRWKVPIPGRGWSSPIVWGDTVFVTTAVADKQPRPKPGFAQGGLGADRPPPAEVFRWEVYCLDRTTGRVHWQRVAAAHRPTIPIHPYNSYATETPATDGQRVYAYFGAVGVFCYDFAGRPVWRKELGSYPMQFGHGTGASPALDGGRLFIQCDNEEQSFLVALDTKTGRELWRVGRDETTTWTTPFVWKTNHRTAVVCCGEKKVRAYDPATGRALWELGGLAGQLCASPAADAARIYLGSAGPWGKKPLVAVRAAAAGDVTLKAGETANAGVAWSLTQAGPALASPLAYRGYLYVLEQRGGMVSCYDSATGQPMYRKARLPEARGFVASPWAHGDKIFCLDEEGQTFVLRAGPEFQVLGKNQLDDMFWASPALAGGDLFLRGLDHLYCIKP
jgi:outer membrane protein assembly factor BamB